MSDFTDFFPAAGGGSIGQTIKVGDYSYPNAQSLANFIANKINIWGDGAGNGPVSTNIYDMRDAPYNYGVNLPTANTYVTVADITNATNGGACYGITGFNGDKDNCDNNSQFTFRITLDGASPVEYAFYMPSSCSRGQFAMMGKNWVMTHENLDGGISRVTSGQSAFSQNTYYGGAFDSYFKNYDTNTNTFWSSWPQASQDFTLSVIDTITASTMGLPYLYFTTSLKVEVKLQFSTTMSLVKAGAQILTF